MPQQGITELFAALTVSKTLREKFLEPTTRLNAIKEGYMGSSFDLSDDEIARLLLAEGKNLAEVTGSFLGPGKERE